MQHPRSTVRWNVFWACSPAVLAALYLALLLGPRTTLATNPPFDCFTQNLQEEQPCNSFGDGDNCDGCYPGVDLPPNGARYGHCYSTGYVLCRPDSIPLRL